MARQTPGTGLPDHGHQTTFPGKVAPFGTLWVWDDTDPRPPAEQMAADEVLLAGLPPGAALLRHYRWLGRAASFGYGQSLAAARGEAPGFDLVRRWTGGGVVRHDADWTFSLLVGRLNPFAALRPQESYGVIHAATARALAGRARLAGTADVREGLSCFSAPARDDLLAPDGAKVCGGAQRRTRSGILHQGSLQNICVPSDFLATLAAALAEETLEFFPPEGFEPAVHALTMQRYGQADWLGKVP